MTRVPEREPSGGADFRHDVAVLTVQCAGAVARDA